MDHTQEADTLTGNEIAVIGLACRFPGAQNVEEYLHNLQNGIESISFLDRDALEPSVIDYSADPTHPDFVSAAATIEGVDLFDAHFFGYTPKDAALMDPQQRLFLEYSWMALESAGYDSERYDHPIGVFAGARTNTYVYNLFFNPAAVGNLTPFELAESNDFSGLSTRVAYKLNLRGPAYSIHTACSTGLAAVHLACQSVLIGECRMAIAGGVAVNVPQQAGYLYREGGIASPDGHCRAFDAGAAGTLFGSGIGVVVLKRLEDALEDGDTIHAVIKGSAANNDGSAKASYTAPSVEGQAAVILDALTVAGVAPETISYVEAHGTGTPLGDPIEIRALTKAFRSGTSRSGYCAIGSVKTNFGHLESAAGLAGLIKVILALKHKQLPPSLHFNRPNPNLQLEQTPFYVNTTLTDWQPSGGPRRAGVSSFGVGGTNIHIILEEAPPQAEPLADAGAQLLVLSARSEAALDQATERLLAYLKAQPARPLADVAYTLQLGRRAFEHRRALVCRSTPDAIAALDAPAAPSLLSARTSSVNPRVIFMFPGQGAQYVGMGAGLYQTADVFRTTVDRCAAVLQPLLGLDIRSVIFSATQSDALAAEQLKQTHLAQPALFVIEYALAQQYRAWGIQPHAMIGHSIGEYVAACLAEVFTLEDALMLVAARGQLMQQTLPGAMLSVALSATDLSPLLRPSLSLAAINGPQLCVVAGPADMITAFQASLTAGGVEARLLHTSHAFHSPLMDAILPAFAEQLRRVRLRPPQIPFVSNLTGTWISPDEATDPEYWVQHLRQTVRFADGLTTVQRSTPGVLLEVGPGRTLTSLAGQVDGFKNCSILTSMQHPQARQPDEIVLLTALGKLWLSGVSIDWTCLHDAPRRRVSLPTYPFERQRYWIDPLATHAGPALPPAAFATAARSRNQCYTAHWHEAILPERLFQALQTGKQRSWLVFLDPSGLGEALLHCLRAHGQHVQTVRHGTEFRALDADTYTVAPEQPASYSALIQALRPAGEDTLQMIYLWGMSAASGSGSRLSDSIGLSLLIEAVNNRPGRAAAAISVVTSGLQDVMGEAHDIFQAALLKGLAAGIRQACPERQLKVIDLPQLQPGMSYSERQIARLLADIADRTVEPIIAYRGQKRWHERYSSTELPGVTEQSAGWKVQGAYLLAGDPASIGSAFLGALVDTWQIRLVVIAPPNLPEQSRWPDWLATYPPDDRISRLIQLLQALDLRRAQVLVCRAELHDPAQLQVAVDRGNALWEPLQGVLYGAPRSSSSMPADSHTLHTSMQALATVRAELDALHTISAGYDLDAVLLCDVLSARLGEQEQPADAGVSFFLEAYARERCLDSDTLWVSVHWDVVDAQPQCDVQLAQTDQIEILNRVLAHGSLSQVLISAQPPDLRLAAASAEQQERRAGNADDAAVAHARPHLQTPYAAPGNEIEQGLVGIWEDLLGVKHIGIHDNFFELGGHSLLATRLVSHMRDALQLEVTIGMLFATPTIAELAEQCTTRHSPQHSAVAAAIPRVSRDRPLPLSFSQQRLWFLQQLDPASNAYALPFAVRLHGPLDVERLKHSFAELMRRHEILSTVFPFQGDEPSQVIVEPDPLLIMEHSLENLPPADHEAAARQILHAAMQQPFDLLHGPLLRAGLIKLDSAEHMLYLIMHHIISDGWSMSIVVDELVRLYELLSHEQELKLDPLTVQYADYAVWQRRQLQGSVLDQQLSYWQQRFANMPPLLSLPTDYPRPAVQTYRGAQYPFALAAPLTQALHNLSQQEGATLFMTLLAAFASLLARYSDQDDLVIGSPIANRTQRETERLIGCFVNTLVFRIDLSGNPSFRALLGRVRTLALEAYQHQDLPFEKLVDALGIERDLSRAPLFQVMLALHNTPGAVLQMDDLVVEPIEIDPGIEQFDLSLNLHETAHGLKGTLGYNIDLFAADTIARLASQLQTLLERIVANPDRQVLGVSLLSASEERQLLVDWNDTAKEYSPPGCLHQLFEAQAARTPQALALAFEDLTLDYQELDRRTNQLAHYLHERGVGPEVRVGLYLSRSPELLIGLLGVLKAGGVYVPLDPAYPPERLTFMVADAGIRLLLTAELFRDHLPALDAQPIYLDSNWNAIARYSSAGLRSGVQPNNLAYVMYTSGSTGKPKGVANTHAAISNRLLWGQDVYPLSVADRVLQIASFGFDIALWELIGPLLAGAAVVMARPGGQQDSAYLADLMAERQITVAHFVPSLLHVVLEEPELARCNKLRGVFCGGEALPRDLPDRVFERLDVDLVQFYGPTEASINATCWFFEKTKPQQGVPIGQPIANTRIYLLDRQLQLVPIGVPGELYIGGAGLARNYHNRPDQTAEKFIPDPFSSDNGARLYRTGDIARYRADGVLEFLGRRDAQVKVRGFRIELSEIETLLSEHPLVAQAVVALQPLATDKQLVAYVVLRAHSQAPRPDEESVAADPLALQHMLHTYLRQHLPDYMIPLAFMVLDALPLNAHGKLDRAALPKPDLALIRGQQPFVPARTPTELMLADIWGSYLKLSQIGIHDNFFALGGHSLMATQIITRMRRELTIDVPVRELFERPTIAALAELIDAAHQLRSMAATAGDGLDEEEWEL